VLLVGVAACVDDPDLCAEFGLVEDPIRDRCVCPPGTSERDDGGGCELLDGGFLAPPDSEVCTDDSCACVQGTIRPCSGASDVGACVAGTQTCVDGAWDDCVGATGPTAEICDGIDNDCDGVPDNGSAAMSCGSASRATRWGALAGSALLLAARWGTATVTGCSPTDVNFNLAP
jgi:hypothetical protein